MSFDGRWEALVTIAANTVVAHASNSGGGPTAITVNAGTYSVSALVAHFVAQLNALRAPASWSGTIIFGAGSTGQTTIGYVGGAGTWTITWDDLNFRDLLGFTANLVAITHGTLSTGPKQARGLWLPDCPFVAELDPRAAPPETDRRTAISPTGVAYTHVGNKLLRHRNVNYALVAKAKIWEANAVLSNASLETFWTDVQLGFGGLPYFSPGGKCLIYDMYGAAVGINANAGAGVAGWYVAAPRELSQMLTLAAKPWNGLYQVAIGDITTDG